MNINTLFPGTSLTFTQTALKATIWKLILGLFLVSILVVIAASVHLAYVAIESQPECVSLEKSTNPDHQYFKPAKSSC